MKATPISGKESTIYTIVTGPLPNPWPKIIKLTTDIMTILFQVSLKLNVL